MPVNSEELLKAAEIIAENKEMKATLAGGLGGAGITGAIAFVGALIAGPIGLAVGGSIGGLVAYSVTKNRFKPVVQILREDLDFKQKEALAFHIQQGLKDVGIEDVVMLVTILSSNQAAAITVFNIVKQFLEKEMHYKLTYQ